MSFDNSKVLISNMAVLYSNCGLKVAKQGIFGSKSNFFLFYTKLCVLTKLGVLISNIIIVFSNFSQQIPKQDVFGLKSFFIYETLHFDIFQGAYFDYCRSVLQFWPESTKLRQLWSQIQSFLFCMKLCLLTNSRMLMLNMTIVSF